MFAGCAYECAALSCQELRDRGRVAPDLPTVSTLIELGWSHPAWRFGVFLLIGGAIDHFRPKG